MPTPQTPYDAVLNAARDVASAETALDAELVGAALLGSVYAISESQRGAALREFVGGFLAHTARRRSVAARTIRTVFAALAPDATGADAVRPGPDLPAWSTQVGRVRPVGTWAYGDVYGDQTTYLAIFEYDDPDMGGPEHAVVALVDHNIGIVKDMFVGRPGRRILAEVRRATEADELVWLEEVDPSRVRSEVSFYLEVTDGLSALPEEGSLATDRALAGARLATLPPGGPVSATPPPADPALLTQEFLESPQAATLELPKESLSYAIRLVFEFAQDGPDGDPLRWSPAVAGLFLLDWVHRRAVLDDADATALPPVLRAWSAWAGARRRLPSAAVAATTAAIDSTAPEFLRLYQTGERRGIAVQAMAAMLAAGVDPQDPAAVSGWLAANTNGGPPL